MKKIESSYLNGIKQDNNLTIEPVDDQATFIEIDRNQEDRDVALYQRTGDNKLFEKIYKNRIPTLQIWARQYHYLMDSKEDMFGELGLYFLKAIRSYRKSKGSFNTCLFTFFINHIRNLHIGRNAKKRIPQFMDRDINKYNFMLSLEYKYRTRDSSENSLKDVIPDNVNNHNSVQRKIGLEETMNYLSHGCPVVKGFLRKVSNGSTLSSALKEYKTKTGYIKIGYNLAKKLTTRRSKNIVRKILKDKVSSDNFSLVEYHIGKKNKLYYTIEMKKTREANIILRTIRKLKKNREVVFDKLVF